MRLAVIAPGSLALLPAISSAFQPLITDDTGTQGIGGNQLEVTYVRFVEREPNLTTTTQTFPVVFTRGWTDTLDVYAGASHVRFRASSAEPVGGSGAGNAVIGLKWRFHESESDKWSLALKPEIWPAVSNEAETRGLGTGRTNVSGALILTKDTAFGAVHANLAVSTNWFGLQDNRVIHRGILWRFSVAPVFDLTENWKAALDAGFVTNPHKAENASMGFVEFAAIYSPSRDLDFALGLNRDVHHRGHRVKSLTVGATWRIR